MTRSIYCLLLIVLFAGCTHLASVSTSQIPQDRSKVVKAEANRFMFLLFNFDNNFVNTMVDDLARQCPDGKVQGILTKQESIVYFPLIAHAYRVSAQGYCVSSNDGAANKARSLK
jgi:hypothetical protein